MYDFAFNYTAFGDGELLYLASRFDALLPDDQAALACELERRGLERPCGERCQCSAPLATKVEVRSIN